MARSHVVGYVGKDVRQYLSAQIPCFVDVNGEGVNIQNIKPNAAGLASGDVTIQIFNDSGRVTSQYAWVFAEDYMGEDPDPVDGWYNEDWDTLITDKTFASGEGFKVYSTKAVTFTYSGEVNSAETTVPVRAYLSAQGNIRPTTVDIQDIVPSLVEGTIASGEITIQIINDSGKVIEQYAWVLASDYMGEDPNPVDGWYNEDWDTLIDHDFAAGEGFLVYSTKAAKLTFPALSL